MQAAVDGLHALLKLAIEEHSQRFVPGSTPRDYIDTYLQQIEECDDPKSSFYKNEGGICSDLHTYVDFRNNLNFSLESYRWTHKYVCRWF